MEIEEARRSKALATLDDPSTSAIQLRFALIDLKHDPISSDRLAGALEHPDPDVRVAALRALNFEEGATEARLTALEDPERHVRFTALETSQPSSRVFEKVRPWLLSDDPGTQYAAWQALKDDPLSQASLVSALESQASVQRARAASLLAADRLITNRAPFTAARTALLSLLEDPEAEVRLQTVRALWDDDQARKQIAKMFQDPAPSVRAFAVGAMDASSPAVQSALGDPSPDVITAAIARCAETPSAADAITALLNHSEVRVRLCACAAMGGKANAKAPLIERLNDESPLVRRMAVFALGQVQDAWPALRSIHDDPDRSVIDALACVLRKDDQARPLYLGWLERFRDSEDLDAHPLLERIAQHVAPWAEAQASLTRLSEAENDLLSGIATRALKLSPSSRAALRRCLLEGTPYEDPWFEAAELLLEDPRESALWLEGLTNGPPTLRFEVLNRLQSAGFPSSEFKEAVERIWKQDDDLGVLAGSALVLHDKDFEEAMIAGLRTASLDEQRLAISVLGASERGRSALLRFKENAELQSHLYQVVPTWALESHEAEGWGSWLRSRPEFVEEGLALLDSARTPGPDQRQSLRNLRNHPEHHPALLPLLDDPKASVRRAAFSGLADGPLALEAARRVAKDKSSGLMEHAEALLWKLEPKDRYTVYSCLEENVVALPYALEQLGWGDWR